MAMLTVRLTHPRLQAPLVRTWDAARTGPAAMQLAFEEMGVTCEILGYDPHGRVPAVREA